MKIHIFFRHYNVSGNDNRGRTPWFDFEKCFINLLSTIKDQQVDLHVIMDGKIKENWISKYSSRFTGHEIKAGSDPSSFQQTYKIAKNTKIEEEDLVYFLENDYLHINGWVDKVKDLFETYNLMHYISLYDHNDKYFSHYEDLVSKIIVSSTHHWRTTPSTCGSFIIKKPLFDLDFDIHTTIVGDHNKFIYLYKDKQRLVITPIPGLSTHCMDGLLSPTIDWKSLKK